MVMQNCQEGGGDGTVFTRIPVDAMNHLLD